MLTRFCLLDADYDTENQNGVEKVVVRLFGVDESGKSVLILDKNFRPYFYAIANKKAESTLKKNRIF
jgi:DNA polymerase elongation subunit (family B)